MPWMQHPRNNVIQDPKGNTDPTLQESELPIIQGTDRWDPMGDSSEGSTSSGQLAGLYRQPPPNARK